MNSTFHQNIGLVISQVECLEIWKNPLFACVLNSPSTTNTLRIKGNREKPGEFYTPPTQKKLNLLSSLKFLCYLGRDNHTRKKYHFQYSYFYIIIAVSF